MAKRKATIHKGKSHSVTLAGRELTLCYDMQALQIMLEATGVNLIGAWDPASLSPKEITCMLYAACYRHHPEIEIGWYFEHLTVHNFGPIYREMLAALTSHLPKPEPTDANPPQPPALS